MIREDKNIDFRHAYTVPKSAVMTTFLTELHLCNCKQMHMQ